MNEKNGQEMEQDKRWKSVQRYENQARQAREAGNEGRAQECEANARYLRTRIAQQARKEGR